MVVERFVKCMMQILKTPVIISTSGTSPCQPCGAREGLKGVGAVAVDDYYSQLIANKEVMEVVDALNLNISDHFNGYGMMDGKIIPNCWTQYDLARAKLDKANYFSKKILSSESWIVWDNSSPIIMMSMEMGEKRGGCV